MKGLDVFVKKLTYLRVFVFIGGCLVLLSFSFLGILHLLKFYGCIALHENWIYSCIH